MRAHAANAGCVRMLHGALLIGAALALTGPVSHAEEPGLAAQRAASALFRAYASETAPYFPFNATQAGAHQYDGLLANNLSAEYRAGLKSLCGRFLSQLRAIDKSALNPQFRLSYDIFEYDLANCVERMEQLWHLMPVDQVGFSMPSQFASIGAGGGLHPFRTPRNYEDFLKRMDGFAMWIDTAIENMRTGIKYGVTPPRAAMIKVLPQLDVHVVENPESSVFYQPIRNFPAEFAEETRRDLRERYHSAIQQKVVPAYRRLRDFMRDEYIPACRTSHGLLDLPDGVALYRRAVRVSTTTDLPPEQIYELGLAEVGRIQKEIAALREQTAVRTHAELERYRSVERLLEGYRDFRVTVERALPSLFGRFPKSGFEIRAIEEYRERSMPSSYIFGSLDGARPGVFYLNASALRRTGSATVSRSLYLHESVPGHHFQVSLQRENKELPLFRRMNWSTAFSEGWALYAESLGRDLGLYANRRDELAMLYNELYRAARLVVDVGIHLKGWTREQAIDYMIATAGDSRDNAEREVERYMAWPGQALSYKIGQLKILEIRDKARAHLGAAFDIREFHDELLKDGSMPLSILEGKMDRWAAARTPDPKREAALATQP